MTGCRGIVGWKENTEVVDSKHNLQPVFCIEYITALEDKLTMTLSDGGSTVTDIKVSMGLE